MTNGSSAENIGEETSNSPTIVAVEFGAHYMKIRQLIHIFATDVKFSFHVRAIDGMYQDSDFTTRTSVHRYTLSLVSADQGKIRASLHFYKLLFLDLRRGSYLWVVTAPEQNVLPDLLFLMLLIALKKPKAILSIGAPQRWMSHQFVGVKSRIMNYLRRRLLKRIQFLTFETQTQRSFYLGRTKSTSSPAAVLATYSSDILPATVPTQSSKTTADSQSRLLRVGLLGGVSEKRRDYSVLIEALNTLGAEAKVNFTVVVLGSTLDAEAENILEKLRKAVAIERNQKFLFFETFASVGKSCDVLLSPLRKEKGYGTSHGSGSFGDAILLRKRLILPFFADPGGEFSSFSSYYASAEDLAQILLEISAGEREDVPPENFYPWRGPELRSQIARDFGWPENFVPGPEERKSS